MILNAIIEKDVDGYFAQILELKGCVTQGKTYEEALFNIKEAAELYRSVSITPIEVQT